MKVIDGYKEENLHFKWSPHNSPVAHINPGEKISIKIPDSSTMQMKKDYSTADLARIDHSRVDAAVGPVYVDGAEKGDALKIKIESIETGTWGWSAMMKDFGSLSNMFGEKLIIWELRDNKAKSITEDFLNDVTVPLNPFLGIIGTAPEDGEYGMIPPQTFGGNMDNRFLRAGSTLYLPVNVPGALISFSDPHATQGDGEVCGTAIETSCTAVVTIELIKNKRVKYPRIESMESMKSDCIVSMGIGDSMEESARTAIMEMIDILSEYGFSGEESYILCSVAGNLRISEMVDMPNFVVSLAMDKSIIENKKI
ncbi:MAG: acetamidase/formamidase family protein [Candidatus Thermoplasmatota archaeon]|uniref:acetamidase/formamidase family protein n=1 Tax=Ferroplasma sp. TaxID=2591003 RepID=UPI00262F61D0|nr:acetamidase/formamidase family protein [Ferroplasma sp.]MCL4310846.1 acetamidase/formamidase family protein [Candidatus Thermoplasmatota archaeon]